MIYAGLWWTSEYPYEKPPFRSLKQKFWQSNLSLIPF